MNSDPLNPLLETLSRSIGDLDRRLKSLERARQPYQGDWIDLNPTDITYISPGVFQINNVDILFIGDKIKLIQSGITKYFYVDYQDVETSIIFTLIPNGTVTFDSSDITSFAYSRVNTPSGFPAYFDWVPTIGTFGGGSISVTSNKYNFVQNGKLINLLVSFQFNPTSNPSIVTITLPVLANSILNTADLRPIVVNYSSIAVSYAWFQSSNQLYLISPVAFTATPCTISFDITYQLA